jgi:hypothetical protein
MKRWHGSCIGAILVLLIGGGSLFFFVPFGGARSQQYRLYLTGSQPMSFVPTRPIIPTMTMASAHRPHLVQAAGPVTTPN